GHALEGVPELLLAELIDPLDLLLLTELLAVLRRLAPARRVLPVLARRVRTTLHRALLGEALGALQEELRPLATALPADGSRVTHCSDSPPLGGTAAVVRNRRDVPNGLDLQTGRG